MVCRFQEVFDQLESAQAHGAWSKIKYYVDKAGEAKTITQCKTKIRNLKDEYKKAKDNNNRTGASPVFPPYYHEFNQIYGDRDIVNIPNLAQVGVGISSGPSSEEDLKEAAEAEEGQEANEIVASLPNSAGKFIHMTSFLGDVCK